MAGFTSRDDAINEITVNGKQDEANFYKIALNQSTAAGVWHTLWDSVGQPGAGSAPATTPGTVYVSDATTPVGGSIWFPDRSTDVRSLLSFGAVATVACTLMLYDRLAAVSGLSLASTGSKTANTGALDRYAGVAAVDNEVWLEVTTAMTVTSPVVNLNSYTSADGTTTQVGGSVTFPTTAKIGSLIQLPLTAAKQGVRSVEAGLNVGTAASAGIVNLLVIKPLVRIGLLPNIYNEISLLDDSLRLPRIFDNACLGLAFMGIAAAQPTVQGVINSAYG